jgi:hypothetical protein
LLIALRQMTQAFGGIAKPLRAFLSGTPGEE